MIALWWHAYGCECEKRQKTCKLSSNPHIKCDGIWEKLRHLWANPPWKEEQVRTIKAQPFNVYQIQNASGGAEAKGDKKRDNYDPSCWWDLDSDVSI